MKALKTILVLVCVMATSTILTGCHCCQTNCCCNETCNTCTSTVTHADHLSCQRE